MVLIHIYKTQVMLYIMAVLLGCGVSTTGVQDKSNKNNLSPLLWPKPFHKLLIQKSTRIKNCSQL